MCIAVNLLGKAWETRADAIPLRLTCIAANSRGAVTIHIHSLLIANYLFLSSQDKCQNIVRILNASRFFELFEFLELY